MGFLLGMTDGEVVCSQVGTLEGLVVGRIELGVVDDRYDGVSEGELLGSLVGTFVRKIDGKFEGIKEG